MTTEEALRDVIRAWESNPGGRYYSPKEIERWLAEELKPAMDQARKHLGLPIPANLPPKKPAPRSEA